MPRFISEGAVQQLPGLLCLLPLRHHVLSHERRRMGVGHRHRQAQRQPQQADILFLKHDSSIFRQTVIQPCTWLMEEPSQFSMGQTVQGPDSGAKILDLKTALKLALDTILIL